MKNQNAVMETLRRNPALLKRVMESPDGQILLQTLNQDGAGFRQAVESAAQGSTGDMMRRLREFADSPGGMALLERIRKTVEP